MRSLHPGLKAGVDDSITGRFIQPDTIVPEPGDPQSLNRYSYVLNNPLKYGDPTGHCPWCIPVQQCFVGGPCQYIADPLVRGGQSVWTQIQQLTVQYGPQVSNYIVQLINQYANQAVATADGIRGPAGNAGNTAGPGGLDPKDPLFQQIIHQTGESDLIKAIAKASVKGPAAEGQKNGITVLGRYPTYVNTATELRANYLNFAEGTWEKLTDVQRWAVNKQFLDDAIARGDTFKLASLIEEAKPGTYFYRELEYLVSLGYRVVDDVLIKVN